MLIICAGIVAYQIYALLTGNMGNEYCSAPGCTHQRNTHGCTFHKIPFRPLWLRRAWLVRMNRVVNRNGKMVDWKPNKNSKLCGCHFSTPPPSYTTFASNSQPVIPTLFNNTRSTQPSSRSTVNSREIPLSNIEECQDTWSPKSRAYSVSTPDVCSIEEVQEVIVEETHPALRSHDYMTTTKDGASYKFVEQNPDLHEKLQKLEHLEETNQRFDEMKTSGQILSLENIKENSELFVYYTGLPSFVIFMSLFSYLKPKANDMKYPYGSRTVLHEHFKTKNNRKPGKKRSRPLEDEFFMILVRLRLGLPSVDCAVRFGIASSTFSSIFTAWVTLLSHELEKICKMPPTEYTDIEETADCFKEFSNVKIIIDCTELFSETPSSLAAHKQFHSSYKHHSTVKFLVGMNTGGAITYVSDMYGGRASDKLITTESGDLLRNLCAGQKVMADRGFTIQEDLPVGVQLIMPSFKHKDKSQYSKEELHENKKISEARVHIERAIRRVKQWQILAHEMKLTQVNVYENIFKACAYLVNFQDPFLKLN